MIAFSVFENPKDDLLIVFFCDYNIFSLLILFKKSSIKKFTMGLGIFRVDGQCSIWDMHNSW